MMRLESRFLVHLPKEALTLQASTGKFMKKSFIVRSITEMAKGIVEFLNKKDGMESEKTNKEE